MTQIRNLSQTVRQILIVVILISISAFMIFTLGCLLIGKCYGYPDATIAEIDICIENGARLVNKVPAYPNELFICGKVVGTTPRPGRLYLFYDDKVIYSSHFEKDPGAFYEPLPITKELAPGNYRIEIRYARRTLARTEFSVYQP